MLILYVLISNCRNLLLRTDPYIHHRLKVAPRLRFRGCLFSTKFRGGFDLLKFTTQPCQIYLNDKLTKANSYKYTMRFLSTLSLLLMVNFYLAQDTIDTVLKGDVIYLYKKGLIVERHYMKGDQIDVKVIYIYRDGLLVRREWWKEGKRISYTIEN